MCEIIIVERRERVGFIKINRPEKMNAMNERTKRDILEALEKLRNDDEVGVVVITGAGDEAFSAGADVNEFQGRQPLEQLKTMKKTRVYEALEDFPKLVIAMINGYALGGGCELALACDIRIASEKAKIGLPEIKLGLIPGGGATQRLPRLVGEGRALEMILTGEPIEAGHAKEIGLVDHVVPHERLEEKVMEVARKITEGSPIALRLAKEVVRSASRMHLSDGIEYEMNLFSLAFSTDDRGEGVSAFIEKREPRFKGR